MLKTFRRENIKLQNFRRRRNTKVAVRCLESIPVAMPWFVKFRIRNQTCTHFLSTTFRYVGLSNLRTFSGMNDVSTDDGPVLLLPYCHIANMGFFRRLSLCTCILFTIDSHTPFTHWHICMAAHLCFSLIHKNTRQDLFFSYTARQKPY